VSPEKLLNRASLVFASYPPISPAIFPPKHDGGDPTVDKLSFSSFSYAKRTSFRHQNNRVDLSKLEVCPLCPRG